MSIGISAMFEQSESLLDARRVIPAVEVLEQARTLTNIPDRWAWATYNLGAIHWARLGDGETARREFLAVAAKFDEHPQYRIEAFRTMHANALENAMLCALAYDEFDSLAARLRAITPGALILAGLVPQVADGRQRGAPWSHMLLRFASGYYTRNDSELDRGRYGEAKSTYHLLLVHRRALRLSREDWRLATFEVCALAMRMTADCLKVRGDDDRNPPDEYLPIMTDVMPLVDEYLAANPGDDDLKKTRGDMDAMVSNIRGRWLQQAMAAQATHTARVRCRQCHKPMEPGMPMCPACGAPSSVMLTSLAASIVGAGFGAVGAAYALQAAAPWLRVAAMIAAGLAGFFLGGSIMFQMSLRGAADRGAPADD